jgi:hypothetical protein
MLSLELIVVAIAAIVVAMTVFYRARRAAIVEVQRDLTSGEVGAARRTLRRSLRAEPVEQQYVDDAITTLIWAVQRSLDVLRVQRVVPLNPRASGTSLFSAKMIDEARGLLSWTLRDIIDDVNEARSRFGAAQGDDAEWAEFQLALSRRWMPHLVPQKGAADR